jgi:hypothetical protein
MRNHTHKRASLSPLAGNAWPQLIRRNEELATLYEKIKIQRTTLKKCEALYKSRRARRTPSGRSLRKGARSDAKSRVRFDRAADAPMQVRRHQEVEGHNHGAQA